MFLTVQQFLDYFPTFTNNISKDCFVKQFIVTYSNNPSLKKLLDLDTKIIKTQQDPRYINQTKIIDYFYDLIITNRHKYLTKFYQSYIEFQDPFKLSWDHPSSPSKFMSTDQPKAIWEDYLKFSQDLIISQRYQNFNSLFDRHFHQQCQIHPYIQWFNQTIDDNQNQLPQLSLQKNDASRRLIRNLHLLDILHNTKVTNTCKSKTSFWQTLLNVYNHLILEDRFFAPSSLGLCLRDKGTGTSDINYNNFFYLLQQYQPKASILNPYVCHWILTKVLSGTKLLTPVLSWSSYMVAFLNSNWCEYVGIDVMPDVCKKTQWLFDHYKGSVDHLSKFPQLSQKTCKIYCQPSETLIEDQKFIDSYCDYFDGIMLCPPYFDMELYPEGQQSTNCYPDYHSWLYNYWMPTMALCHICLRQQGRIAIIVNDYVSLQGQQYPLIQDFHIITSQYFKLIGLYKLVNRVSPLRVNHKQRTEMLLVYEK